MSAYIQMNCPRCQHGLRVRAEYLNCRVACKHCQHIFTVTGAPAAPPVPSPAEPNLAPRVEALEQELRQAHAALDASEAERRKAAQQLEQRQEELEQARARLKESEAALERVRQQLQQAATTAEQRDDALAECDQLRAEAGPLKERAARADILEKELDAERSAVADLRAELQASKATFHSHVETSEKTLAQIHGELEIALAEVRRLNALVKEQENFRQECDRLKSDLAEALAEGEQAAIRLQAESQNAEELRSQLLALQRSLEETTTDRDQAQQALAEQRQLWDAERAALHREWEENLHNLRQEAAEQLRLKEEESDRDRHQTATLEAEIDRLTQESSERQREHAAALERVEVLARERDRLAARAEELQRDSTEAERRWQSETARLNEELDALRGSQAELQHQLEEARGQLGRERELMATYREERDGALHWQTEADRLSNELDELRRLHTELQHELETARGQFDAERLALRGEAGGLGEKLDEAVRRAEHLEKERDDAVARFGTLDAEVDSLRQIQARLREDLAAREQEIEAARDAAREAQERLASAQSNRERSAATDGEALEQALASAQQEFIREKERLQAELTRAQSEATSLRQALESLGIMIG